MYLIGLPKNVKMSSTGMEETRRELEEVLRSNGIEQPQIELTDNGLMIKTRISHETSRMVKRALGEIIKQHCTNIDRGPRNYRLIDVPKNVQLTQGEIELLKLEFLEIIRNEGVGGGTGITFDGKMFYLEGVSTVLYPHIGDPIKGLMDNCFYKFKGILSAAIETHYENIDFSELDFENFPIPTENPNFPKIVRLFNAIQSFACDHSELVDDILNDKEFALYIVGGVSDPVRNQSLRKDLDLLFYPPGIVEGVRAFFRKHEAKTPDKTLKEFKERGQLSLLVLLKTLVEYLEHLRLPADLIAREKPGIYKGSHLNITPWLKMVLKTTRFKYKNKDYPQVTFSNNEHPVRLFS